MGLYAIAVRLSKPAESLVRVQTGYLGRLDVSNNKWGEASSFKNMQSIKTLVVLISSQTLKTLMHY